MTRVSPAARFFALLLVADAVLLSGLTYLQTGATWATAAGPVKNFLHSQQQNDSWRAMHDAIVYLASPHDRSVYDEMLFSRGVKFQYPLSSLLFVDGLPAWALLRLSQLAIVVTAWASWIILGAESRAEGFKVERRDWLAAAAVVGLVLTFFPVIKAFAIGQIQAWITAMFACAVLAWQRRREATSGVMVGLMVLMKPTYAPLALWGLLRRRSKFAAAMLLTVAIGSGLAVMRYGWRDNVAYTTAVRYMASRGEVFAPNQSFNGALNRVLGNGDSLKFSRSDFAPFSPAVSAGTLLMVVVTLGWAFVWPMRVGQAGDVGDFCLMTLAVTMASPIAWDHHYGVLVPILAACGPAIVARQVVGRWTWPALIAAYLVASQFFPFMNGFAGTPLGVLQSYLLAAACGVFVLVSLSLRRTSAEKGRGQTAEGRSAERTDAIIH